MSGIDWAILAIVGLSTAISLIRGFVAEALSILVWLLALWVAFRFTAPFAEVFLRGVEVESIRLAAAAIVLLVGVLLIGGMAGWLIGRLLKSTGLSGTDRLLGAVFGALRGALTVLALVVVASWTPLCQEPWWTASRLLPAFERLAVQARVFLPEGLRAIIGSCRAEAAAAAAQAPTAR
ncbi:MAG: CvpA family protein [Xanthomonadales bacterium]|nr:hypothetical protein [Xanthomonadales bacterium]MCC6591639.1 CvpA family protein [Xanthomonadales bacterium]MCE7930075.1 CvpA family protein [Xanthomonadales bacterium PRO6]